MSIDTATVPERDLLRPLRYLWRVPLVLLHIVLGILLCSLILSWNQHVVMQNGKEPFAHRMIRWWSTSLLRVFGMRSVRFGEPLADPVLFVANHTSWLDIELLHSQRAACFVAKAEIAQWPLVGWLAANGGTIFHRRGSNHSLSTVMQVMVERLRGGRSPAFRAKTTNSPNGVWFAYRPITMSSSKPSSIPCRIILFASRSI